MDGLGTRDLVDALQGVVDAINAGAGLRGLLGELTALAERATGADGAVFTVMEAGGSRVLVTTPGAAWLQGRFSPYTESALATLLASGERSRRIGATAAHPAVVADLVGHGIATLHLTSAASGSTTVSLDLLFRDPDAALTAESRGVVELLASAGCAVLSGRVTTTPEAVRGSADPAGPTEAMADGLAVLDAGGTVSTWNPAAAQLTGLTAGSVLGGRAPFPVPAPGQVLDHRLGSGRWLELVCSPPGPGGRTVVTFRDVTRPKLADEAKDLVLATAGHELRTPVTVVRGYAEMLAGRWDVLTEVDRRDAVRVIVQRTTQLADLVDRLLLGDRADPAALAVRREPFDLLVALRQAVEQLPGTLVALPVLHLPDSLPAARGDRASIATVLTELWTNAVKYTPGGADPTGALAGAGVATGAATVAGGVVGTGPVVGSVEIRAAADRSSVWFQVADRGIGVRPEDVEKVFGRFWQADSGDQRRFGGVGLGLYIVRHLLDRQGGWVAARPRDGGGTIVEVRLPRADAERLSGSD